MYGGIGLIRCDGISPTKRGCAINAALVLHKGMDDRSGVSGDPTNMGGSALSIYANGSGCEREVLKGLVNMNSEPKDVTDTAESGCSKLNDIEAIARVNQPFSKVEGSGLVLLPLLDWVVRLREKLSGYNVRCSPTGGDTEMVTVLLLMPRPWQLTSAQWGSSPNSSGGSAGP